MSRLSHLESLEMRRVVIISGVTDVFGSESYPQAEEADPKR